MYLSSILYLIVPLEYSIRVEVEILQMQISMAIVLKVEQCNVPGNNRQLVCHLLVSFKFRSNAIRMLMLAGLGQRNLCTLLEKLVL